MIDLGLLIGNISSDLVPDSVKAALNEDVPMYGVKISGNGTKNIRTYDAANLDWSRSSNTEAGKDDFKDLAPFNVKEVCRVWDGSEAKFYYKNDYSASEWQTIREGKHATIKGDIMIEFPVFWYKRVKMLSGLEIIIAPKYKEGFKPSPWHYVKGILHEKRYISKYPVDAKGISMSGVSPNTSVTENTCRKQFRDKGMEMLSLKAWSSISMLSLVKYATAWLNNSVGVGGVTGSVLSTGLADNVLGLDGSPTSLNTTESLLTFGCENLVGNSFKRVDGAYMSDNILFLADVEDMPTVWSSANDTTYTRYTMLGSGRSGLIFLRYLTDIADIDWLFLTSDDESGVLSSYFPASNWFIYECDGVCSLNVGSIYDQPTSFFSFSGFAKRNAVWGSCTTLAIC